MLIINILEIQLQTVSYLAFQQMKYYISSSTCHQKKRVQVPVIDLLADKSDNRVSLVPRRLKSAQTFEVWDRKMYRSENKFLPLTSKMLYKLQLQPIILVNCTYCCYCLEVKFGCKSSSHNWTYKPTEQNEQAEKNTISMLSWLLVQLVITASFPSLSYFQFFSLQFVIHWIQTNSNEQGRTGNKVNVSAYQIALSWQCCTAVP